MRIPRRRLMLTHNHNKRRVVALTVLSGCLFLAPAAWAQTNSILTDLKARMHGRSNLFDPTVQPAAPVPSSVLPQFVFGGGWYSALYFTNLTGAAVSFPVNFVGDAGAPLTVPSLGGSTTQVNLAAYGTAIVEAPNVGSQFQGYAAFTLPSGVFGYGVFRQSVPGQADQEAVVPLSFAGATSKTLTWEEANLVTAVAIVNPSSTATTVAVTLWDENGNTIGTSSVALQPNSKTAAALRSLPGLSGMVGKRGSARFSVSAGSVAVLGLRFDGLAFTSIPTTTGASESSARSSVLPQFVFGGGWYSALYFTNLTGAAVSFPVNFVGDAGAPLTVPSLGGSTTQVKLAAYGTAIVEAPNVGSLVQGYAAFTLPSGVFGYGVFRQSVPGQSDQEAVVPLSDAGASSNTLTWDEMNLVTAVAIVNPSSTAATVAVTLWDENGNTVGTSSVALPPNSKTAAALRSLPGPSGMVGKRGSARFSVSAGSVAVLGLRFDGLAFTSIPTTTGASESSARSSILPQFAFGGGWYSALYFTNLTGAAVSFPVNFVGDAGTPLTVPSLGGSTTQVNLAAYGTAIVEAPNVGSLLQGYAAFTLPSGVFGYGVFRQSVPGQSDQEAVVPLSDAGASSKTLTWEETNLVTAVAIVNPSSTAATVAVTLWDYNGNTIGTSSVALPPNSKTAAALRSLPGLSGMIGKRGSAQFTV